MWIELLILTIWGGIVALDTTAALQILISQPLVSCTLIGFLLGNPGIGLTVGILMELPWLLEIPAGGARFSESNIGSSIAAASAILTIRLVGREDLTIFMALIIGVFLSYIGGILVLSQRNLNDRLMSRIDARATPSPRSVWRHHFFCIGLTFSTGGLFVGIISIILGYKLLPMMIQWIPVSYDIFFQPVKSAFLGVGVGAMMVHFYQRKNIAMIIFGMLIGAFLAFLK